MLSKARMAVRRRPPEPSTDIGMRTLRAGAGTAFCEPTSCRAASSKVRLNPFRRWPRSPSVRFQTETASTGCSEPRSTSHQGLRSFSAEWVWEPEPNEPSLLPSMAWAASPELPVVDWLALPRRATFWPPDHTSTSARVSVPRRGNSMRT